MRRYLVVLLLVVLTGCASAPTLQPLQAEQRAKGPRIVALVGDGSAAWMDFVERAVQQHGFETKRYLPGEMQTAERDGIHYALVIDANYAVRCMPGGFAFTAYDAKLVNLQPNETISFIHTSGLSENCIPAGTVFATTGEMVDHSWSNQPLVTNEQTKFVACFDALSANPTLVHLRDKVALGKTDDQTFSMLVDNTKPTEQEKQEIKIWGGKRDACMKLRRDELTSLHTPLDVANVVMSLDQASQSLVAGLYNGSLTYAQFATKRRDMASSANEAIARILNELRKQTDESRFKANQIALEAQKNALLQQKITNDRVLQQEQIDVERANTRIGHTTTCSGAGSNIDCFTW